MATTPAKGHNLTNRPTPFEVHESGALLHGTKAHLMVDDHLVPGHLSNFDPGRVMNHVYVTETLDAATWGAELAAGKGPCHIYIVEPSGVIEDDPNVTDKKFPAIPLALIAPASLSASSVNSRTGRATPASRCRRCRIASPTSREKGSPSSMTDPVAERRPRRHPDSRSLCGMGTVRTAGHFVAMSVPAGRLPGMTDIALFHSVLGVRPGVREAADRLRAEGHDVVVVDQYGGRVFDDYGEADEFAQSIGYPTLMGLAEEAVQGVPDRRGVLQRRRHGRVHRHETASTWRPDALRRPRPGQVGSRGVAGGGASANSLHNERPIP